MSKRFDDAAKYKHCLMCGAVFEKKLVKEGDPPRLVCPSCGYIHFVDPKIAATAVFQSDGGIVLIRRSIEPSKGLWVCPGGFVERGETPVQTCIRETREEACVDIDVMQLLNAYAYPGNVVIILVYLARLVSGTPAAGDEAMELGIFPPEKIPWADLAFPSTQDSLIEYGLRMGWSDLPSPEQRKRLSHV